MSLHETKERILKITFTLLLKKGFDGVSISDIQRATGMARGLLYHYFGNKDQLFVEATAHYFSRMFNMDLELIKEYNIPQMIDHVVKLNEELLSTDEEEQAEGISMANYDFLFYRVMKQSEAFAQQYMEYRLHERKAWRLVIDHEKTCGNLRPALDPDATASYFILLMDGLWMDAVYKNSADSMVKNLATVLTDYYHLIRR